ncbi:hypothetical protein N7582_001276 [Saccharomyces uvarum]|uniref:Uncharacterized protein n=1 Tax=Saccharomyces uvarum TaxID=230603 RepID=A0AA35NQY3_SACUV|nr:hypothetical protein N7582_001276 [Saccharomyces uvarum]CAI4059063.1 hypothetical protein SUVC_04G4090 [Saccharomyces uvarum]
MIELDDQEHPSNNITAKRVTKLQHINKKRVRDQIELLTKKPDKNQEETRLLARLKNDLQAADEHLLGYERNNGELGVRSIFYDKDWNLKGAAPPNYRNIPYNPGTFERRTEVKARLGNLENITLPGESPK